MEKYHFLGWNDMFIPLLERADLEFNYTSIAALINYFYAFYPKLEEKIKKGDLKGIRLTTLLDEIITYGSSSEKYKNLLGREDYRIFISNPVPNASSLSKEYRQDKLAIMIGWALERKYITIPPINENLTVNNKKINVKVNSFVDPINFTYGERTASCMRIGGAGETLFEFCLTNENGFHISFNTEGGKFISRVSGFRNGNTVFFNQLRYSVDENYNNEDLYKTIKEVANILVEKTKDSTYPIKNVVISTNFVMSGYSQNNVTLNVEPTENFKEKFYTDVSRTNAIFLAENEGIKLGEDRTEKYEVPRKKINYFTEYEVIKEAVQQQKIFAGLIKKEKISDIELYSEELIYSISRLFVGEDWLIGFNKNNEVVISNILERSAHQKVVAQKEMKFILEQYNIYNDSKEHVR